MATLNFTLTEEINVNGTEYGTTVAKSIANITQVYKQVLEVTNSQTVILNLGTAVSAGTVIGTDVRYLRITNQSDTYHAEIGFHNDDTNDTSYFITLDPNRSYIVACDDTNGVAPQLDANDNGAYGSYSVALKALEVITAEAEHSSGCSIEIMVCSDTTG